MAGTSPTDRRRYTRVNFNAQVLLTQNELSFETNIVDISLNGILADTPQNYEIRTDSPLEAKIKLTDDTVICMSIRLIHSGSDVLGFKCESIDVDSIGHLRRLVELNLNDPLAAERVLSELVSPTAARGVPV